jgi:hypothetical protein
MNDIPFIIDNNDIGSNDKMMIAMVISEVGVNHLLSMVMVDTIVDG